jgi:hypothetical protein
MILHCFESARARVGRPGRRRSGAQVSTAHSSSAPWPRCTGPMPRGTARAETLFLSRCCRRLALAATDWRPLAYHGPGTTVPTGDVGAGVAVGGGQLGRGDRAQSVGESAGIDGVVADAWRSRPGDLHREQPDEPSSAARERRPAYPRCCGRPTSRARVTAEWVVDTVGTADRRLHRARELASRSSRTRCARCLPQCASPASCHGRHGSQLVRQLFASRIDRAQLATTRARIGPPAESGAPGERVIVRAMPHPPRSGTQRPILPARRRRAAGGFVTPPPRGRGIGAAVGAPRHLAAAGAAAGLRGAHCEAVEATRRLSGGRRSCRGAHLADAPTPTPIARAVGRAEAVARAHHADSWNTPDTGGAPAADLAGDSNDAWWSTSR